MIEIYDFLMDGPWYNVPLGLIMLAVLARFIYEILKGK